MTRRRLHPLPGGARCINRRTYLPPRCLVAPLASSRRVAWDGGNDGSARKLAALSGIEN